MRRKRTANRVHGRKHSPIGGWLLFSLYFACIVLLVFSRLENSQIRHMRGLHCDLASPVLQAATQPAIYAQRSREQLVDYLDLFDELDRLKEENQKLRHWRWQAQRLERRLVHMRALLTAVEEPALDYKTGYVIADARGPFARSVLINLGRSHGVKNGYAVINGDGFVGRIVHSGENASRAILLSDLNSRVPVLVGPAAVRAVLVGDNSGQPHLEFLPNSAAVYEGDEITTSGHGGMLPRGLQTGVVVADGAKGYRVRPHAALAELEYVSVLIFDSPVVVARDRPVARGEQVVSGTRIKPNDGALQKRHAKIRAHTKTQ